jgi:hypothetical protein
VETRIFPEMVGRGAARMADLFKKLHIALTTSTRVYNYAYGTQ